MENVIVVPLWIWGAFTAGIVALLLLDLLVFHREAHAVELREAAIWSVIWIALGLAFTGVIWWWMGPTSAAQYVAGYLLEKALSVDNMFVFALIFSYFALPREYQHRVLFWGILGALVFRVCFILAGAALLDRFDWMILVFGGFLVVTGIRMAVHDTEEVHPDRNPVLRLVRRVVPITPDYRGQRFFVREAGRRVATPMLAVLVAIETTDIIFAVDSIPAIFGVTDNAFLVFSSNAFAILGLRALFMLLAGMMHRFEYLKVGLSVVLVFIGAKMLLHSVVHIPIWLSLLVIVVTLTVAVVASLARERRDAASMPDLDPTTHAGTPGSAPDAQSRLNGSSDH